MSINITKIREDFPILHKQVYNKPLIYFDNAASTQKPQQVIEAMNKFYRFENSNVHRGVHFLSQQATEQFETGRSTVKQFINARSTNEIVFTKGTTDSINLLAYAIGKRYINQGDEILISEMEHHSNIVPWQMMCEERGAVLKAIPVTSLGELDMEAFRKLISRKTKILAVTHISNALGTINPVKELITMAHSYGAMVVIDGAQSIMHTNIDVQEMNCDFYCFSGHKIYGPTGIGILYGKEHLLDELPPYQGGGEMIKSVSIEKTTYNELPYKFEAGTPNISGVIGLDAALKYVNSIGMVSIADYEKTLLEYATNRLKEFENIEIYGQSNKKASVISFLLKNIHPFDVGTLIDKMGIAVRTGHHCAEPVMKAFNISGTVRLSLAMYNTTSEIDKFVDALKRINQMFV